MYNNRIEPSVDLRNTTLNHPWVKDKIRVDLVRIFTGGLLHSKVYLRGSLGATLKYLVCVFARDLNCLVGAVVVDDEDLNRSIGLTAD